MNSDLIKFIESNPDTVITLLNGDKILVHETAAEVVARVLEFRRAIVFGLQSIVDPSSALATAGCAQRDRKMPTHPEEKSRG